ncbi:MAG: phage-shock protein [Candidatus Hydrogenedentes bacterium]|nr:phage-shock protein [Candidatus Hydrogenedentota bacterium]
MGEGITFFLIVLTICAMIVALRALRLKYRHARRYDADDTRIMQEINRGMQRMEDRVESLETLLMDRPERSRSRRETF